LWPAMKMRLVMENPFRNLLWEDITTLRGRD
jgi:hypothetical protein